MQKPGTCIEKTTTPKINVNECALFKGCLETMLAIQGQQINGDLHQAGKQLLLPDKIARHDIPLTYHVVIAWNVLPCRQQLGTIR